MRWVDLIQASEAFRAKLRFPGEEGILPQEITVAPGHPTGTLPSGLRFTSQGPCDPTEATNSSHLQGRAAGECLVNGCSRAIAGNSGWQWNQPCDQPPESPD